MSATIVYEGAVGGGDLFAGKKFFFQQRLPQRERWIDLCKSNGGVIVKLDKQADIIIADHARKDSPPGSISYTFVEQSVKKGNLEDIENHRAVPLLHPARANGSTQPTRITRMPFTVEDDRILAQWVADGARRGEQIKGNTLYKDLAAKYPRHTFQSWRDRWIKHLQDRPHHQTADNQPGAGSLDATAALFTEEDDEELRQAYDAILGVDEDHANAAWEEWAETVKFPTHQAKSWRERFETHIKPQRGQAISVDAVLDPEHGVICKPKADTSITTSARIEPDARLEEEAKSNAYNSTAMRAHHSTVDEERIFYKDYDTFTTKQIQANPHHKIRTNHNPRICERQVPLFRMWKVVTSYKFGGYDFVEDLGLWIYVAEELGFDRWKDEKAPEQLKTRYELSLLHEFEDVIRLLEVVNEDLTGLQEERMTFNKPSYERTNEVFTKPVTSTQAGKPEPESSSTPQQIRPKRKRPRDEKVAQDDTHLVEPLSLRKLQRRDVSMGKHRESLCAPAGTLSKNNQEFMTRAEATVLDHSEVEISSMPTPSRKSKELKSSNKLNTARSQNILHKPASSSKPNPSVVEVETPVNWEEWMLRTLNSCLAQGYPEDLIFEALEATNSEDRHLDTVLGSLTRGNGIPNGIPGVWTAEDDQALLKTGLKAYSAIVEKHGEAGVKARKEFKARLE